MHYYGERYKQLYLPGSSYVTESHQHCTSQPDACSTTCHPLSIIKSPVPRWQSYVQPFTYVCSQPSVTHNTLLPCQPCVQQCVVLCPEPCENTHLLPCRKPSVRLGPTQVLQSCENGHLEKKRVAKSLPPCAPRCPEPGKLKYPPCGIRYSSSCKNECRSKKVSRCSSQRYGAENRCLQGMTSGYSLPLRGVTECPPQQCVTQCFLEEYISPFPHQKCSKGYPMQECITTCTPQQVPKCPPGSGAKGSSSQQRLAKCSLLQEGAKHKSSSAQHISKSKCLHPCATQRSPRHHAGDVKRSSHSKKSRCASKWLW
ncbi:uncharacterized protein LOC107324397 [Coturnix japonica]|uniref:Uncharacterized LOC107324397 n=1 Tax=Coturnix japonica TaxID=93934 RepID=A0A8C2TR55_COTJA|nr:uncharacterized protein LOC107324397 [Coturnix japonica]